MAVFTEDLSDALPIVQTVTMTVHALIPQGGLVQSLPMTQTLVANLTKSPLNQTVAHEITVGQTITRSPVRPKLDSISVGQTIIVHRTSVKSVSDTLTMTQFVAAWKNTYHWINPGVAAPTSGTNLVLHWDVYTVTLRNPVFNDQDKYEASRIKRNSRGGDLIVYRDPMWPTQEILSLEFEYLSSTQAADLLEFFHVSLGHLITLTDQYGRDWTGYLLTPEADVIQDKRVGFGAKFDFQGTLVE